MNDMTELRPTLRSEWRELRRNRSMLKWFAVLAVVSIVLTTLLAFLNFDEPAENGERAQYLAVLGVTAPNRLGQLLIGVLGALIVSGRRGRRMSRRAVAVSAATFAAATLIVSTAMYAILVVITVVVLASSGTTVDLSEGKLWVSLLGGVMNLPLAGLVGFAIGAIVPWSHRGSGGNPRAPARRPDRREHRRCRHAAGVVVQHHARSPLRARYRDGELLDGGLRWLDGAGGLPEAGRGTVWAHLAGVGGGSADHRAHRVAAPRRLITVGRMR